jgi:putative transposase
MIDKEHPLPVTKQCQMLELSRSSLYYVPAPVNDNDRELMRIIDEIHLEGPYLGSRGMKNMLRMRGYTIGRIHVRTLMRKMGIEALYKKPRLSEPHPGHMVYPYLLRGLDITEANSVWCSDITYTPWQKGSVTLSQSWIGRAGRYCPLDYRIPWMPRSALRPLKKQS